MVAADVIPSVDSRRSRGSRSRIARARIAWAVTASVAVHLWIVDRVPTDARRAPAQAPALALAVWLEQTGAPPEARETADGSAAAHDGESLPARAIHRGGPQPATPSTAMRANAPLRPAVEETPRQDTHRSLPAPADPVYYSAHELDVYPSPAVPLRFGYPSHIVPAGPIGSVLLSVKVDEAGTVEEAAVIAADPPGYFEAHTRAVFAAARFSPGRRDGKAVKSQVTVRVDYDPAAREGALR